MYNMTKDINNVRILMTLLKSVIEHCNNKKSILLIKLIKITLIS